MVREVREITQQNILDSIKLAGVYCVKTYGANYLREKHLFLKKMVEEKLIYEVSRRDGCIYYRATGVAPVIVDSTQSRTFKKELRRFIKPVSRGIKYSDKDAIKVRWSMDSINTELDKGNLSVKQAKDLKTRLLHEE